tara:strand:- start:1915 stop:2193 length:279 start_codon:yes stop_codon:yes gene_type:complete
MEKQEKKIGTATIDINEYDRLMSIERDFDLKVSENTKAVKFLKEFFLAFDQMEKTHSYSFSDNVITAMGISLYIKTSLGEIRLGRGKDNIKF